MKRKSKQDVLKNLTLFLAELHSTLPAFLSLADLLAKYQAGCCLRYHPLNRITTLLKQ